MIGNMDIRFSRHAKRRAKLYNLSLSVITEAISEATLQDGQQEILKTIPGMSYRLKIIVSRENELSAQEESEPMKVHYDDDIDALYLSLGDQSPDGAIEIAAGVNLDTTSDGKIVGIEILDASNRMDIKTILSYTLDLEHGLSRHRAA